MDDRSSGVYPFCYVSESVANLARRAFELLQKQDLDAQDFDEVSRIISEDKGRDVLSVVDWQGFSLLQTALLKNHTNAVRLLLRKGADPNACICSPPLHLACRLGSIEACQLLVEKGSRPELAATVCLEGHKLNTYPDRIVCLAYRPILTAAGHAIAADHDEVLQVLLNNSSIRTDGLLHDACRFGAKSCVKLLLQHLKEQVSAEDSHGRTPLQVALLSTHTDNAAELVQAGAKLATSSLHAVYANTTTPGILRATHFALENGARIHINSSDRHGDTALHILLKNVGRQESLTNQATVDKERLDCIDVLLRAGANPHKVNKLGEGALHAALVDHGNRPLYVSKHGCIRKLRQALTTIVDSIKVLLRGGAKLKHQQYSVTPFEYALRFIRALQPDMIVLIRGTVHELLLLLSQSAEDLSPLLASLRQWAPSTLSGICWHLVPFLSGITIAMIGNGKIINESKLQLYKDALLFLHGTPATPKMHDISRMLLLRYCQRGLGPDDIDWANRSKEWPASILASALSNVSAQNSTRDVFQLLCNVLDNRQLNELSEALAILTNHSVELQKVRSLKVLSRRRIAASVRWKLMDDKNTLKLPLPKPLLTYVTNMQVA